MDAFLGALLLLSSLIVAAYFVATGVGRFVGGRATGFTSLGAPRVSFPRSALLGLAEIAVGAGIILVPAPGGMLAAYLAMIGSVGYAWLAVRSYRSDAAERATRTQAAATIGLAGLSVVAIVDSFALTPPVVRLLDPVNLAALLALGAAAGGALYWQRRSTAAPQRAVEAPEAVHS
ncbi:hypothetical protein G7070_03775 [Propioniciclava coleopterorum]|uniref:DoxX-like family protein n=1 Tax=Propioniciclava coleopterorum TaxID=2714937 RepID=A0A6G7Y4J8_9ACTN|nr:hypothetical protein [Propioniciclava coleopterorum]QIK71551.1 hypothetical protein G7070_03775 [Propioniciclava coleopterorum]